MATKKINYDAINFRNKDVDRFSTRFGKDGNPLLKAPSNTAVSESTSVKAAPIITKDTNLQRTQDIDYNQARINNTKNPANKAALIKSMEDLDKADKEEYIKGVKKTK